MRLFLFVLCLFVLGGGVLLGPVSVAADSDVIYSFSPPSFSDVQVAHDGRREFRLRVGRTGSLDASNTAAVRVSGSQEAIVVDDYVVFGVGESQKDLIFSIDGSALDLGTYESTIVLMDQAEADRVADLGGAGVNVGLGAKVSFSVVDKVDPANIIGENLPELLDVRSVKVRYDADANELSVSGTLKNGGENTLVSPGIGLALRVGDKDVQHSGLRYPIAQLGPGEGKEFQFSITPATPPPFTVLIESCCSEEQLVTIYEYDFSGVSYRSYWMLGGLSAALVVVIVLFLALFRRSSRSRK